MHTGTELRLDKKGNSVPLTPRSRWRHWDVGCEAKAPVKSDAQKLHRPNWPQPVSYTHLDVYKRQLTICVCSGFTPTVVISKMIIQLHILDENNT